VKDERKSKAQLIKELSAHRQRVADYEKLEAEHGLIQRKLHDSENRFYALYQEFQGILNAIPDTLDLISPDSKLVWANEAAAASHNKSLSDIIGQYCYVLRHNRSEPCKQCPVLRCFRSGKLEIDEDVLPDGRIYEWRAAPVLSETGEIKGVIEVARNITGKRRAEAELELHRKHLGKLVEERTTELKSANELLQREITRSMQIEEALKNSSETLQTLINATSETLLLTDTEGKILIGNETVAQRLGKSVRELIGASQYDYFPPDVAEHRKEQYDTVVRTGRSVRFEDERAGRHYENNAYPVFDEEGKVFRIAIFAKDITQHKLAEDALRESENKFRDLAEKSLVGIYLIQDEVFKYVNAKLAEILGFTVDEMLDGMGPKDTTLPEDWPIGEAILLKRLSSEIKDARFEFRIIRKNRETRNVEIHSSLTTYQGEPAIIGTMVDITERKQVEEERERLILELQSALSRIKTLGGLLPICSSCKKIRNDKGYWEQIEVYIRDHSELDFSHGICPDCMKKLYPDYYDKIDQ